MSVCIAAAKDVERFLSPMVEDKSDTALTIFIWAAGIYVSANLAALGFLSIQVLTLNSKMTQLEASRITASDVEKLRDSVTQLALRMARIPDDSPPKWLVDKVDKMERQLEKIERIK